MGLSLSTILLVYTGTSVARAFFVTRRLWRLSLYGYTTRATWRRWDLHGDGLIGS